MNATPSLDKDSPSKLDDTTVALLKQHFWCDFSDMITALKWDETGKPN